MYLKLDHNTVIATSRNPQKNHDWIAYEGEIPTPTETQHLEYVNGRVVAVENVSKEELRRQAYETEVDPLVSRYVSYFAEMEYAEEMAIDSDEDSDAEEAYFAQRDKFRGIVDGIIVEIARKKAEIRERYPDEVQE